ncbi:TPA: PD-(D/E)XK nuclease-like domain-containing protein [Morganella morganii]|uniref:PD-(D/E)XK nuclease-like domain-containing protein n=1 Tax=Morganella morganii TaxID=582 RepID=UPI000DCB2623|nr:PD-(D/E)XK nuclease-like domain-containing protein [Morganella morganii]MDU2631209.1 PD-(D/E)XK nuclease-like domain-containing protein [Morganella morganii]RAX27890.1 DNA breaking-rejoining protein [Morganella morganii]
MATTNKERMDANLAAAIMLASSETCIDIVKATTDLIARINGDKSNQALEKYDNIIFRVGLAATSSTCLQSLPDEQCIEALAHVIMNMDKYPATSDKKQYFESLCVAADHSAAKNDKQTVYQQDEVMTDNDCQVAAEPPHFEPGRYPDIPNETYHASNGISSTMLKDARISLMYYQRRHITKVIQRERSEALDFGSLFHTLVLEPEKLDAEFSLPPVIPADALTNTESMKKWIESYNAGLSPVMSNDELKAEIEAHNATLPQPLSLSGNAEEIGSLYVSLPDAFRTIPEHEKHTAAAMKACIKMFNNTLPVPLKTSGGRIDMIRELEAINPELVEAERSKPDPLLTSGKKEDLITRIKAVSPETVFADELMQAWQADESRIRITGDQLKLGKAMQEAVYQHPEIRPLINHPGRAVEVSYYGIDEDTGLEVRVRPDLEISTTDSRIGFDMKSVSLGRFKQDAIEAMIRREILNRDYHVSAAMYCDIAELDQFFWIFVNKDENYNWVAVVEASPDLLELGRLEYKKTLRDIRQAMDTDVWPGPVTTTLTIGLSDFDMRRLESLQMDAA